MLVLMRKLNESIKVGDDIWVTVIRLSGNQVHIGIDAPKDVTILREEILEPGERRKPYVKP